MSQSLSRTKITRWDSLIIEAEEMLKKVEAKANRLRTSITVLKESRDLGEPWPGDKKAGTEQESIPA